jgi:hypothetical protein
MRHRQVRAKSPNCEHGGDDTTSRTSGDGATGVNPAFDGLVDAVASITLISV